MTLLGPSNAVPHEDEMDILKVKEKQGTSVDEPVAMEVQSPLVDQTNAVKTAVSERFMNTAYGFFLDKRVAYPVVANYVRNTWSKFGLVKSMLNSSTGLFSFQFSFTDGLNSMLENGSWFIANHQLILFLKDNIVMAMPKITEEGHYICNVCVEYEWKPPRPIPKKPTTSSSDNKKKGVEPTIEVSNSNPFDVLSSVDNDVEFGTIGGTTNLVNNRTTSSGSSFMNVDNSSSGTTPIIDKIEKFEELLTSGQAILVDKAGNPLKKVEFPCEYDSEDDVGSVDNDMACSLASERVGFGTQSLLEQWRDSYGNGDYDDDAYDDDMYEGQDLSQELHAICDNLDIQVRGRKKK
ncbi:RNA-directed DNA polymerase, eukaryota, reverse transcriptase zinc-binding domain protein [Tanacetum coccineum]